MLWRFLLEPSLLVAALHLAVALPIYCWVSVRLSRRFGLEPLVQQIAKTLGRRKYPLDEHGR